MTGKERLPPEQTRGGAFGVQRKLIILDDDPTGTQTVHGLPVLTRFDRQAVLRAFEDHSSPAFFILTNTRAMKPAQAADLDGSIAAALGWASGATGKQFDIVVRGDSTLRGHFPLEMEAVRRVLPYKPDGYILFPFFAEGGRVTIDDIHYVEEKGTLTPAAQTQFGRDFAFGYKSSNLREYVEEKTGGRVKKEDVVSVSLEDLSGEGEGALKKLLELKGAFCVVNARCYRDAQAFVAALEKAEAQGRRFLMRTAASFVKARLHIADRPLLTGSELGVDKKRGGLVIAGSYVEKTTRQLEALAGAYAVAKLEVDVNLLWAGKAPGELAGEVAAQVDENILKGVDTLVYTSRQLILKADEGDSLEFGNLVSACLSGVAGRLRERPAFIVAKGGITSSDVATKGLMMERAWVCGQLIKGVPLWRAGEESRFPGLAYVVFPGNVGDEEGLVKAFEQLKR